MASHASDDPRTPQPEGEHEPFGPPPDGYPNPQGDVCLDEEDAAQEAQETPGMG